ncbi:MAG: hemolysin III family protein [Acidimicrobiales bacterium]
MVTLAADLAARSAASPRVGIDGRPVPLLRGRLHQALVVPSVVAGALVVRQAPTAHQKLAIAVYAATVVAMFTASAFYHCHARGEATKVLARRLDHTMIYVVIAGTHTAYWILLASSRAAVGVLAVVWTVAAVGGVEKFRRLGTETRSGMSLIYPAMGLAALPLLPTLWTTGGPLTVTLVISGGAVFMVGAVLLHLRRLDLWPAVWGYHETWHGFVALGIACHGLGVATLI